MPDFFSGLPETEPGAATGFAGGALDRRSEHRGENALDEAIADPAARIYLFRGHGVVMPAATAALTMAEARALGVDEAAIVLLGWNDGAPRLAATLPPAGDEGADGADDPDLRTLATGGAVPGDVLGELALARSLTLWHARHGFCANCGAPTRIRNGGFRRDCPSCETQHFPRTDPVVIMLALDGERALLGRSHRFAPQVYSCLAGFMEPGETIEAAVRRETAEESGIRLGRVRYHASQPWPFPSSLMIGCYGEALTREIVPDDDELEDCRWFDRAEVVAMMAGNHPDGVKMPPPMAIAHRLVADWVAATA